MCLAIPGKVVELYEDRGLRMARAEFGGTVRKICVEHVASARVGDYVLVHVGFAISTIDPEEAQRTLALLEELGELGDLQVPDADP